jgi:hypothetical protein
MLAFALLLIGSGCTASHYRKSADKEASKVIAAATPAVPNMDPNFTIETKPRKHMNTTGKTRRWRWGPELSLSNKRSASLWLKVPCTKTEKK